MIRFGVIGTSWITEEFIKCAQLTGRCRLTGVYSRSLERAEEFAAKYSAPHVFTDLQQMAASDLIDAVYIASPNSCHAPQAILFMNHKKHVLCEKPIASNVRELTGMIEAAKENKVLLMEALKTTFLPNFQSIKENLHKIGPVRRILSNKCQYSSRYDAFKAGKAVNTFDPKFSNGSLMDIGIYCIYPIVALFGKPTRIQASGMMLSSGVDGQGSLSLEYDGMDAIVMHSKISESMLASEIQGENGNIIIDKISTIEKVEVVDKQGNREDVSKEQLTESMYYEIKEFIELIENNQLESRTNSHQLSLTVMEILETARRQIGLVFPADQ